MENCLITKLKGTVDNDTLPFYGGITVTYKPYDSAPDNAGVYIMRDKSVAGEAYILPVQGHIYSDSAHTTEITSKMNIDDVGSNNLVMAVYFDRNVETRFVVTGKYLKEKITSIGVNSTMDISSTLHTRVKIEMPDVLYSNLRYINAGTISLAGTVEEIVETCWKNWGTSYGGGKLPSIYPFTFLTFNQRSFATDKKIVASSISDGIINFKSCNTGVVSGNNIATYNTVTKQWTYV